GRERARSGLRTRARDPARDRSSCTCTCSSALSCTLSCTCTCTSTCTRANTSTWHVDDHAGRERGRAGSRTSSSWSCSPTMPAGGNDGVQAYEPRPPGRARGRSRGAKTTAGRSTKLILVAARRSSALGENGRVQDYELVLVILHVIASRAPARARLRSP